MSETVGEFPELQGIIGRYIALAQGEKPAVADAIAEHYKPQGPSDAVPSNPVSIAVALADKLDMLVGFWAIDEKPTGSKDPFALRRAALGVIRIVLEKEVRLELYEILASAWDEVSAQYWRSTYEGKGEYRRLAEFYDSWATAFEAAAKGEDEFTKWHNSQRKAPVDWFGTISNLVAFFADRLKVYLRDKGARHDLIDAVFALPGQDDLLMIVRRVEALGRFLETEDGATLLALVRRALNILKIEEKKDAKSYEGAPAAKLLKEKEEKALNAAISAVGEQVAKALAPEDFEGAMAALAKLRAPVDAFFDKVTVNADDPGLRENRLTLLAQIRALTLQIADFSRIEG